MSTGGDLRSVVVCGAPVPSAVLLARRAIPLTQFVDAHRRITIKKGPVHSLPDHHLGVEDCGVGKEWALMNAIGLYPVPD